MDKNTEVEVAGFPVLERREDWLAPLRGKTFELIIEGCMVNLDIKSWTH